MKSLKEKGFDAIIEQKEEITAWATLQLANEVIPNHDYHGDDTWIMYDTKLRGDTTENSSLEDCIDVNIWNDEDTPEIWRAMAYPLEVNSVGEIQTCTSVDVSLF